MHNLKGETERHFVGAFDARISCFCCSSFKLNIYSLSKDNVLSNTLRRKKEQREKKEEFWRVIH